MSAGKRNASTRLAEERRRQAERDRRRTRVLRGTIVLVVLVALTAVGVAVQLSRQDGGGGAVAVPAGARGAGGGVAFGPKDAPVTVDVYEDFQCPVCRQLEQQMGGTISSLARAGQVRVVFHPLSFLGPESERAANASGCAAEAGRFLQLHRTLFENQPPEHTGGFTSDELVAFGEQAGIDGSAFSECVRNGTYDDWVSEVDRTGRDDGVTGTPTIRVNGEDLPRNAYTAAGLRNAVQAAAE